MWEAGEDGETAGLPSFLVDQAKEEQRAVNVVEVAKGEIYNLSLLHGRVRGSSGDGKLIRAWAIFGQGNTTRYIPISRPYGADVWSLDGTRKMD